ncbi:DoxX family protein [Sandarakinorhabdus oryzae]|uniref:DoxX family protein n=1 Tax=Sandarakinorhabdus oryzae TaxID=2675220 RepID=UPI0012E28AD5|nr:DoxX family protein [Sandarakinorhabdus oryzae]
MPPPAIIALLDWPPAWFLARLLMVSAYLVGAVTKLADWPAAVAEQAHFGLVPAASWAALTIGVELLGPLLILSGRLVWLGAGMLGAFTFLAALLANNFWMLPAGPARFMATNAFFEHLGLVGGFILLAMAARHRSP